MHKIPPASDLYITKRGVREKSMKDEKECKRGIENAALLACGEKSLQAGGSGKQLQIIGLFEDEDRSPVGNHYQGDPSKHQYCAHNNSFFLLPAPNSHSAAMRRFTFFWNTLLVSFFITNILKVKLAQIHLPPDIGDICQHSRNKECNIGHCRQGVMT